MEYAEVKYIDGKKLEARNRDHRVIMPEMDIELT